MPSSVAAITPVAFAGVMPTKKSNIALDADVQKYVDSILAGEISANEVILSLRQNRKGTLAGDLALLRAGVTHLDTSGSIKSAKLFMQLVATIRFHPEIKTVVRAIIDEGFAAIAKHVVASKGDLAPEKWDNDRLSLLFEAIHRTNLDSASISLKDVLPILLEVAKSTSDESSDSRRLMSIQRIFSTLNGPNADQIDQIVEVCPSFAATLRPTWMGKETQLTRKVAQRAFDLLSENPRQNCQLPYSMAATAKDVLLENFSLSWLSPVEATEQIKSGYVSVDRFNEYESHTSDDFYLIARQMIGLDGHSKCFGYDVKELSTFSKYASDTEAMKPLFQTGFLLGKHWRYDNIIVGNMRAIADVQPTLKAGRALLHDALRASFAELSVTPEADNKLQGHGLSGEELARELVLCAINTVGPKVNRVIHCGPLKVTADPEFIATLLRDSPINRILSTSMGEDLTRVSRDYLKSSGASPEAIDVIKLAMVESGVTQLGSLRRKDLTAKFLGSTLVKNPQRLAEVKNLDDFVRLAKIFSIPINLPDDVMKAASTSSAMHAAIAAQNHANPLDAVSTEAPKRRKARV